MIGRNGQRLAWRDGDITMVSATALVGFVAIIGAWFGASGVGSVGQQVTWLNLALAGLVIFAVGNCLWLMRGRRAIGERRVSLVSLDSSDEPPAQAGRTLERAASTATLRVVRVAGTTRVHHPDCPLVAGKQVQPATVADGRSCGVCSP